MSFGLVKMCFKFTTSTAEKTFSCNLLKNVLLKGSILKVLGRVWTKETSISIYFKIVGFYGYGNKWLAQKIQTKNKINKKKNLSVEAWQIPSLK